MATILVVDDEVSVVRVMSIWLERNGHNVITASNGADALDLIDHYPIDLVITDMNMPSQDGLELIQLIRNRSPHELPIILLTARCDQDKLTERLEPYAVRVYAKPFVPSRLVAEINGLLEVNTI